jgi:hypothetical protein
VWTATGPRGLYIDADACHLWTSSSGENFARIGEAVRSDREWTDIGEGNGCNSSNRLYCFSASKFLPEETFANVTFIPIPEPSAAALATAALATLGLIRVRRRRR